MGDLFWWVGGLVAMCGWGDMSDESGEMGARAFHNFRGPGIIYGLFFFKKKPPLILRAGDRQRALRPKSAPSPRRSFLFLFFSFFLLLFSSFFLLFSSFFLLFSLFFVLVYIRVSVAREDFFTFSKD